MLCVLIRSTSPRRFYWVPITYVSMEKLENTMWIPPLICSSEWIPERGLKWEKKYIFYFDDQSGIQNRWSIMKFWPIPNSSLSYLYGLSEYSLLFVYMSVCLSACLHVFLSVCLSVRTSVRMPVCLPVFLSVCLFVCLSVCLPACLPLCLSVTLL